MQYNVDTYNGKTWNKYNAEPGDKEWAFRLWKSLSDAGVYVRIVDTEGNSVDPDEISGRNAVMRLSDEYQLGWQECWVISKRQGGFCTNG